MKHFASLLLALLIVVPPVYAKEQRLMARFRSATSC